MWETLHNNAGWDCSKNSDFAGDLEDSKSTLRVNICAFSVSHTFVPMKLDV